MRVPTSHPTISLNERRSPIADLNPAKNSRKERDNDAYCLLAAARGLDPRPKHPGDETPPINWAARHLRVRDRKGANRFLRANPAQVRFEQNRGQCNIILKARQMGVTTWIAGRFFLKTIIVPGTRTVMVAQTRESAEDIFGMVKRFWECLNEEDQQGIFQRSIANAGAMHFPVLDSEFRVLSAADKNAGRGMTIRNLHCSEVARWPGRASDTLAGLRAALVPGGELVIESTPKGAYGCFYDEWNKALDPIDHEGDAVTLVRHFFPWWIEPSYVAPRPAKDLTPEEDRLMAMHGLSLRQIAYRRSLEQSYHALRSQEFAEDPETCFRATGDCCFDAEAIEKRLAEIGPGVGPAIETRRGGTLQIYLPPRRGKKYLVGVDPAGGGSDGDFAAVQVIELQSGLQCAELQQKIKPVELAQVSAELAKEYNNALVAVERNNHGGAVLALLEKMVHYPNLYAHAGEKGWLTTVASKSTMVGHMGALLAESPELFLSRRLLAECRTFVSLTGGRTGAASGSHDDCFMAMAVAQAVRDELLAGKPSGCPTSSV